MEIVPTLGLFFFAALLEIGGGCLVWKWLRNHKGKILGLVGALILFSYGIIMTLQPADFGKVYASYGGIFVVSSIIWGNFVDKKKPDRFEIIGSVVVLFGVFVMFYFVKPNVSFGNSFKNCFFNSGVTIGPFFSIDVNTSLNPLEFFSGRLHELKNIGMINVKVSNNGTVFKVTTPS